MMEACDRYKDVMAVVSAEVLYSCPMPCVSDSEIIVILIASSKLTKMRRYSGKFEPDSKH